MPMSKARGYNLLAHYYDMFFDNHKVVWGLARQALIGKMLDRATSVCDLCCGTANTAVELAGKGIKAFAVDLSATMCKLARSKAQKAKAPVQVLRADMRDFELPEKVDIVICEYDAVNHVPAKSDLGRVARAVNRALVPGGYFYFDVNTKSIYEQRWPVPYFGEGRDVLMVTHGGYDVQTDKGWLVADFFIRDGRRWRRSKDRIDQVCWSDDEIRKTLQEAGFENIQAVDMRDLPVEGLANVPPGWIVFYVAQKASSKKGSSPNGSSPNGSTRKSKKK
jgi:SAM-dependent methyltransferase